MERLILFSFLLISSLLLAQHQDKVDFTHTEVAIKINPDAREVVGEVIYTFEVLGKVDSVFLDARNMDFFSIRLDNKKVKFSNNGKTLSIYKKLKKGKTYALILRYKAKPKQAVYFVGYEDDIDGNEQIWTQGQGKYTSHWLPSIDSMEEKIEFDLDITFDSTYKVVANGKLQNIKEAEGLKTWSYDMQKPMSSYLLAFAIGEYDKKELTSASGIPIENYYYPADHQKVESTYRYTKQIFDFIEDEIGVPYPWQNYKQLPVKDFLYAGMENTGATIFSDSYVIDPTAFNDKNYVNVNAHELAHQWFGNLVTEKDGNHHWLHEGFATYYAYLAEKEIFGDEYFYWKLYDSARQLHELSKKGEGEALTNPKASSLTFYEKGAWALLMLREEIGGAGFKEGMIRYLKKHQFKNVTIQDFLSEMELVSSQDLTDFKELWLNSSIFPFEKAKEHLIGNSIAVNDLIKLKWELTTSLEDNQKVIQRYWDATTSEALKARIILEYHKSLSMDFIRKAFDSNSLKIRQALATTFDKIPPALMAEFESLLNDKSYITIENALYKLWVSFPKDRTMYLDKTKNIIGLPNRNVRMLWLLFAVLTKDYGTTDLKEAFMTQLFEYTSPKYDMDTRQTAFGLINGIFKFSDQNLLDLINATIHHSWQFKKFARNMLDELLKEDDQRKRIINLSKQLKDDELRYINTKLNSQ